MLCFHSLFGISYISMFFDFIITLFAFLANSLQPTSKDSKDPRKNNILSKKAHKENTQKPSQVIPLIAQTKTYFSRSNALKEHPIRSQSYPMMSIKISQR